MAPAIRQGSISKFLERSMQELPFSPGATILDIPCGFGRHAHWLAKQNYNVVAIDLDEQRVTKARDLAQAISQPILWAVADLEQPLPILPASIDAIVVIHYVSPQAIAAAYNVLKPGGYLIFETFEARGQNWRDLPRPGDIRSLLEQRFEDLLVQERQAGPDEDHVAVRARGRRRSS